MHGLVWATYSWDPFGGIIPRLALREGFLEEVLSELSLKMNVVR